MTNFNPDVSKVKLDSYLPFLKDKSICIFGASGLIGRYLLDLLVYADQAHNLNLKIQAVVNRAYSLIKLQERFAGYDNVSVCARDLQKPLPGKCDFDLIVQAASPADPMSYATNPVGTFLTNVDGCKNVLEWMASSDAKMVYLSSGEVYGQTQPGEMGYLEEDYGYIDHLTPRACYSMGKRAAETLCRLYLEQYKSKVLIARLCHIYGPTISERNSRADAQFLRKARAHEDIVLKSKGDQVRSYCYVADACTALLEILKSGSVGEAYNISNDSSVVSIYDFAKQIAEESGVKVCFSDPSILEAKGFSKVSRAVLSSKKLQSLGWLPEVSLKEGVARMLKTKSEME